MMHGKVKIGIVQFQSKLGDVVFNVKKACGMIEDAAKKGADIVCLPELFATGYDLNALKEKIIDLSVEYFQYIKDEMGKCAASNHVYLIAPFGEIRNLPGIVYNSALVFDDSGNYIGSFAKSHLWALERLYFKEGNDYPVFDTKFGKIGILICYDAGFPEPSRIMCLKGAEIVFYPSAWRVQDEDMWDLNLRQRALENSYFTCGVNRYDPSESTLLFGKSKICSPRGNVVYELPKNEEAAGVFEIDLNDVQKNRDETPYLRDRKPKIYGFILND